MLAEYPDFADAHAITQGRLVAAWGRRKRLEARLIANEVGRLFGGQPAEHDEIDQATAIALLGIPVKELHA
jgi:hypothetical protein